MRARNQASQVAHHLAAVAHAKSEAVTPSKKISEFVSQTGIEQNRFCPALPRAQYITVGKAATGDQPLEIGKMHVP